MVFDCELELGAQFGNRFAMKADHVANAENTADENIVPLVILDESGIAFVREFECGLRLCPPRLVGAAYAADFECGLRMPSVSTYQLLIEITHPLRCVIGRLGEFEFPRGRYVYTGSARRAFEARIARHLRQEKTLRWHIDYLLAGPGVRVVEVVRSRRGECALNQSVRGQLAVVGFGASDCKAGCGAHLKYLGPLG